MATLNKKSMAWFQHKTVWDIKQKLNTNLNLPVCLSNSKTSSTDQAWMCPSDVGILLECCCDFGMLCCWDVVLMLGCCSDVGMLFSGFQNWSGLDVLLWCWDVFLCPHLLLVTFPVKTRLYWTEPQSVITPWRTLTRLNRKQNGFVKAGPRQWWTRFSGRVAYLF